MTPVYGLGVSDLLIYATSTWLLIKVLQRIVRARRSAATPLQGPPSQNLLFGAQQQIIESADASLLYEKWASEYGGVFKVPGPFGKSRVVLCDPKAIAHFYSRETFGYIKTELVRAAVDSLFGRGLVWSEGESHRRQRKALTPAFGNPAIRRLTSVFYDSTYKAKANWDTILESSSEDGAIIDVQKWMNNISLDTIGIAGFSYDFGSLDGKDSPVLQVFESFSAEGNSSPMFTGLTLLLSPVVPLLLKLPTKQKSLIKKLRETLAVVADELLEKTRQEKELGISGEDSAGDKSVIGLLIKAENADPESHMSPGEILAQMNVLLLAGYESTSISLTWALIQLSKQPVVQDRLRKELLSQFHNNDPTWEQLASSLPYLDGVVHEILRLHPALEETICVATEDDVLPLSEPIVTTQGQMVSSIALTKGTAVSIPISCINRSETFWGPDAKEFRPERWLDESGERFRAKEIQGHRHLLTFVDGPRTCLGKNFALAELKAALSVLIRNYTFEFPGGPETKIGKYNSILPRPKVVGEDGARVPLRVRRVE